MRKSRALAALSVVVVLWSACAVVVTPDVTMLGPKYPAKAKGDHIEVFETHQPERPYEEIARVSVDSDKYMQLILDAAKEVGADGVIILGQSPATNAVGVPVGAAYAVAQSHGLTGIAIKYKETSK
jgi:hypothetical protein